jgi:hypothetical protein
LVDLLNRQNELNLSGQNKHQIFLGMSVLMTKCKGTIGKIYDYIRSFHYLLLKLVSSFTSHILVQSLMLEQCASDNIISTVITQGFKNDIDIANQCLYILQFLSCENPSFIDTIFCREQHFLTTLLYPDIRLTNFSHEEITLAFQLLNTPLTWKRHNPQSFFIGLAKSDAIKRLTHLLYTALNDKRHCNIFIEVITSLLIQCI